MNNTELEQKVLEIIGKDNFFDMIMAARDFEPEYKKSDFYKITKMSLSDVIKQSKIFYALQLKDFAKYIQNTLDTINLDNVNDILDKMGVLFSQENKEIQEDLEVFKNLKE